MPDAACRLYPGRTYCIRCGKCKEEEWAAFREAVSNVMIKCLEARGCRTVTLEEQMDILCDPARHIRQSKVTILVENRKEE
jgi:hypothetical protein